MNALGFLGSVAPHLCRPRCAMGDKPILFTEVGYRSIDGANRWPWDWQRDAISIYKNKPIVTVRCLRRSGISPGLQASIGGPGDADPFAGGHPTWITLLTTNPPRHC